LNAWGTEAIVITPTTAMKVRRFLQAVPTLALAAGLALAQSGCESEPPIRCIMQGSQTNDAIGQFTPVGTPRVVAGAPANACDFQRLGQGLPGLFLPPRQKGPNPMLLLHGFEAFSPSPTDPNQSNVPTALALKAEWIGDRIQDAQVNAATDMSLPAAMRAGFANYPYVNGGEPPPPPADPTNVNRPYAFGKFDSVYPDSSGICRATLTASEMDYPEVPTHAVIVGIPGDGSYASAPGTLGDMPATHVRYEWKNFRAVVTTESLGVEAFADVRITRDGCQADYQVSILSPRVPCTATDSMGNPLAPPMADRSLCNGSATPKNPLGSGITPSISPSVSCEQVGDPMSPDFECMPTKTAP
jgi:hypothetical protein